MSNSATDPTTLEVRRTFPVSRERLYAAWTDPQEVRQWFGPEGVRVLDVRMDVRPGGEYLITATHDGIEIWNTKGEFREVTPPAKLVYTWRWMDDPDWEGVESIVTVEFTEQPGGAEICLRHSGFPNAESSGTHEHGWTGTLDKLAKHLGS